MIYSPPSPLEVRIHCPSGDQLALPKSGCPADLVQVAAVHVDDEQGELVQARILAPERNPGSVRRGAAGTVVAAVGVCGDPHQTVSIRRTHGEHASGPVRVDVIPALAGESSAMGG